MGATKRRFGRSRALRVARLFPTPRALHSPRISRRSTVHSERRRSSQPVTSMAEGGAPPVPRLNLPKDSVESFRGNLAEDSYTSAATFSGRGSVSMRKPAG